MLTLLQVWLKWKHQAISFLRYALLVTTWLHTYATASSPPQEALALYL